jgi:hypothetical protein
MTCAELIKKRGLVMLIVLCTKIGDDDVRALTIRLSSKKYNIVILIELE